MCRLMYLLTTQPLHPRLLDQREPPGVQLYLPDPARIPELVDGLPHAEIYGVASSQGCACGFESYATPGDDGQWTSESDEAEMRGLQRLIGAVLEDQPEVTLCTAWDFRTRSGPLRISVQEVAEQDFDDNDLVLLSITH